MDPPARAFAVLMADDDQEDCLLVKEALAESNLNHELCFVSNGEELLDYVHRRGDYQNPGSAPRADLILLDLNMPKMDGRDVLRLAKSDGRLRQIPIVVLTTSTADEDISFSYAMGASSYITKPTTFRGWVDLIHAVSKYWFELVKLPPCE